MNAYKPGQSVRFSVAATVLGVLTDAALTLTLHPPAGSPIADSAPVHDGQGAYHSDQAIPFSAAPGLWVARWQSTGIAVDQQALVEVRFRVDPLDF